MMSLVRSQSARTACQLTVLIASLAVTHVFSPPFGVSQVFAAHQASQWNRQQTIDTIQAAMQRQRLMLPPHPVMAQLV
jgi:hypothetical protein